MSRKLHVSPDELEGQTLLDLFTSKTDATIRTNKGLYCITSLAKIDRVICTNNNLVNSTIEGVSLGLRTVAIHLAAGLIQVIWETDAFPQYSPIFKLEEQL